MLKSEFSLEFEKVGTLSTALPVVIVAAGNSSRMKGTDKQELMLFGMPVLARTLKAFEQSAHISEIVVVTREEKIQKIYELAKKYGIGKLTSVVIGGASREESVKNGLEALGEKYKKALIHDGARPLVSANVISRVALSLETENCVICGIKVKDTVKKINKEGFAQETLNRDELILVQTPQGVNIAKFLDLAKTLPLDKFTDDASLLEAAGEKVKVVEGEQKNIKITTSEDVFLAEAYLRKESENEY